MSNMSVQENQWFYIAGLARANGYPSVGAFLFALALAHVALRPIDVEAVYAAWSVGK